MKANSTCQCLFLSLFFFTLNAANYHHLCICICIYICISKCICSFTPFAMLSTNWLCEHDPPFHVDPSGCPPTVAVTAPKRISEQPFPYFFHFPYCIFQHFSVSSRVMGMPSSECTPLYFLSTSAAAPLSP